MKERSAAVRIMTELLSGDLFLQEALERYVYSDPDNEKGRAFTVFLVRGVSERKILLGAVLQNVLTEPMRKLKKQVLAILYVGAFELLYGDSPSYAVVNEYVTLASRFGMKGLVNAVLRRLSDDQETIFKSLTPAETLSFSPFLYGRFVSWYGEEETGRMGRWFFSDASKKTGLRILGGDEDGNAFRKALADDGIRFEETVFGKDTLFLLNAGDPTKIPGYREGRFYLESPGMTASVAAVREWLLDREEPVSVWDACASPGGKATAIADLLRLRKTHCHGQKDRFLATDRNEEKCRLLRENLERCGFLSETDVAVYDATEKNPETFDLVNLDVPCSGLGVLSGKPEGKERIGEEDLKALADLQRKILDGSESAVKPGGLLLYSTCTVNPEENGGQIRLFLSAHPEFELLEERQILPGEGDSDGFYFARMRRHDGR